MDNIWSNQQSGVADTDVVSNTRGNTTVYPLPRDKVPAPTASLLEAIANEETYHSSMYEVPMHCRTFNEILSTHAQFNDTYDVDQKPKMPFGLSQILPSGPSKGKGPKSYASLKTRVFPDDVVENWLCMHNFETRHTRVTAGTVEGASTAVADSESTIGGNLRTLNPFHGTVFEKYDNTINGKGAKRVAQAKRKTITGTRSIPRALAGQPITYSPAISAYGWRLEFARSLAGYYVSTYVLGCDSRTADNVMLSPTGDIFNFELSCLNIRERLAVLPLEYSQDSTGLQGGYKSNELDPANNRKSSGYSGMSGSSSPKAVLTPPYPGFNSLATSVGSVLKSTA